jgi:hypothetical protein
MDMVPGYAAVSIWKVPRYFVLFLTICTICDKHGVLPPLAKLLFSFLFLLFPPIAQTAVRSPTHTAGLEVSGTRPAIKPRPREISLTST